MDYSKMTQDDFDKHLLGVMECMSMEQVLSIPGVHEAVSEELNNEVLDAWASKQIFENEHDEDE
jgi:hypothetical protein